MRGVGAAATGQQAISRAWKLTSPGHRNVSSLQVATAINAVETRLKGIQESGGRPLTDKEELALRLNKQYPQDVGVLSVFFLNLVKLQAGQVRLDDVPQLQPLFPTCICRSVQACAYLVAVMKLALLLCFHPPMGLMWYHNSEE